MIHARMYVCTYVQETYRNDIGGKKKELSTDVRDISVQVISYFYCIYNRAYTYIGPHLFRLTSFPASDGRNQKNTSQQCLAEIN